ncbi:MAG: hypothetical protein ACQESF_05815 [Nanobdellota archaeon]
MKKLDLIAMFLITLVISLPFYSSITYANINSATVKGEDGLEGVVLAEDMLSFSSSISENVTVDDIIFKLNKEYPADSCVDSDSKTQCYLNLDNLTLDARKHDFKVFQYSGATLVDDFSASYYVDNLGPKIQQVSLEKDGNYTIKADITDLTCADCDCAGPQVLNIINNNQLKKSITLDSTTCSASVEHKATASELGLQDGSNELCFKAVDKLGNSGSKECIGQAYDSINPEVNSFRILGEYGNEIKYISETKKTKVDIFANITEANLSSVTGDFSEFNSVLSQKYDSLKAECSETGEDAYSCKWEDLYLKGSGGELDYTINAIDEAGNMLEHKDSVTLNPDNTPPLFKGLYNNRNLPTEKLYMKKSTNRIWAEFANDGAGYSNAEAYVDFTFGSVRHYDKKADDCIFEDDSWFCYWDLSIPTSTSASTGQLTLTSETKDDAGNTLETEVTKAVYLDGEKPEVLDMEMPNKCPYSGQQLILKYKIRDDTPVSESSTPLVITKGNNTYTAACDPLSDDTHSCELKIDNLVSKYSTENLRVKIEDAASNEFTDSVNVEVCERVSGAAPFDVKMDYQVTGRVNRKMLSFVSLPVVVDIKLTPATQLEIIDKKVNCNSYVKSERLVSKDSDNPQLVTRLKKTAAVKDADSEKMSFSCTLDLIAREGKVVYSEPLSKNLNITVDAPEVGGISDSIQEKIDGVNSDIEEVEGSIEDFESWNKWLSMLCSIGESMAQLNAVMALVKSVVYVVSAAMTSCCGTPYCYSCSPGWAIWNMGCSLTSKINGLVNNWVWSPGVKSGWTSTGQYIKTFCMLYSCKICTLDYAQTYSDLTGIDTKVVRVVGSFAGSFYGGLSLETFGGPTIIEGMSYGSALQGAATAGISAWGEDQKKPSHSSLILDGGTMNPYKSIHAARSCLCIPGILYNLRKDKQIKCMYRSCLKEKAKKGLSTDVCDEAYRMRECLYVEGAQWKVMGSSEFFNFFQSLIGTIIRNMPLYTMGTAWDSQCSWIRDSYGCTRTSNNVFTQFSAGYNVKCHNFAGALQIAQVGGFSDAGSFDKYSGELKGDTVC